MPFGQPVLDYTVTIQPNGTTKLSAGVGGGGVRVREWRERGGRLASRL